MATHAGKTGRFAVPFLILAALLLGLAGAALWLGSPGSDMRQNLEKSRAAAAMRADLYAAAEAEKSAVLADTDEASLAYAETARAAVERVNAGLERLQATPGQREAGMVREFAAAFAEYRAADAEVLDLAVQNSNLKALALSSGSAAAELKALERDLAPLGDDPAALRAQIWALRIQALHAPHIMEKRDARMNALENEMARADRAARRELQRLPDGEERARALTTYARYWRLTGEIVALSRRNTNLRSLELSLHRTTRLVTGCMEILDRLEGHLQSRLGTRATR
jgi:hypothetical protein